ncbi:MAG: SH3 domain-containing protein [Deltaproteobacteria bacterium]|jgi:tetratricopeptide (TPR) repeat protein|nr:SH3 domain-containing protein [Deltaproteobacteria bacterium]
MKSALQKCIITSVLAVMALSGQAGAETAALSQDDATGRYLEAATLYEKGKYQEATEGFESLIGFGYESGDLYYNLGNARLRSGRLGEAIGSYLQAQRHLPRDGDLAANLKFARQSAKDDLPEWKTTIFETLFFWHRGLSPSELGNGLIILNGIFWVSCLIRLYRRQAEWLMWLQRTSLLAVLAIGVSFGVRSFIPVQRAIVLPAEVSIRASTQEKSTVLFKLHEGAELRVIDQEQDWVRVSLPDDKQGWVASRHVMLVTL